MASIERLFCLEPFYVLALGVPLLLPGQIIPLTFHIYIVVAILLFFGIRLIAVLSGKARVEQTALTIPCLCLITSTVVSLIVSIDRNNSTIVAGYLLFGIAFYFAVSQWTPFLNNPLSLCKIYLAVLALFSFGAPSFVLWKPEFRLFELPLYTLLGSGLLNRYNVSGETIHANVLAGVLLPSLLLLIPLCVTLTTRSVSNLRSIRTIGVVAAMWLLAIYWSLLIILTQSRGAYLGLFVASCLIIVSYQPRLFPLLASLGIGAFVWLLRRLSYNLTSFLGMESILGGGEFRWDVWSNAAYAILDAPITGSGLGLFSTVVPAIYPFAYVDGRLANHAHNLFLQIGVDFGFPGLIAYFSILILCAFMLTRLFRVSEHPFVRASTIGTAGAIVGIYVHGFFDAVLWGTKVAFIPWVIFALITLLYTQQVNQLCIVEYEKNTEL